MFCQTCGAQIGNGARFCPACGAAAGGQGQWNNQWQPQNNQTRWSGSQNRFGRRRGLISAKPEARLFGFRISFKTGLIILAIIIIICFFLNGGV